MGQHHGGSLPEPSPWTRPCMLRESRTGRRGSPRKEGEHDERIQSPLACKASNWLGLLLALPLVQVLSTLWSLLE